MKIEDISHYFNLGKITSQLLYSRGLTSFNAIDKFLNPSLDNLQDPARIPNIESIKGIIEQHIDWNNKILIYGDYDVDGTGGATILYKALKMMGAENLRGMISNRFKDGYGLSQRIVDYTLEHNISLLITVDCGISDWQYIKQLKDKGVDVIVIDHHEGKPINTEYIDLKVESGDLEFTEYCGAGIAWMASRYFTNSDLYDLLDLVAFATIADVVPLVKDNRAITAKGIEKMKRNPMEPIRQLIEIQDIKLSDITSGKVGYQVAPLINAQGRLADNQKAFDYLTGQLSKITDKTNPKYEDIAEEFREINERRKEISDRCLKNAKKKVKPSDNIVVVQEEIPAGVVGLVAGDIKEELNKPVVVIGQPNGEGLCKGSCRSVYPLSIVEALDNASEYLETFGGHDMASGLSIKESNIEGFKSCLLEYVDGIEYSSTKYDMELSTSKIDTRLINDLDVFKPTGRSNPSPKFLFEGNVSKKLIGKDYNHIKGKINDVEFIGFGMGSKIGSLNSSMIGSLSINKWRGRSKPQIYLKEIL